MRVSIVSYVCVRCGAVACVCAGVACCMLKIMCHACFSYYYATEFSSLYVRITSSPEGTMQYRSREDLQRISPGSLQLPP